jgi:hypothetical protein
VTDGLQLRGQRDLGAIVGDSFTLFFAHFGNLASIVFPAAITSLALSLLAVAVNDEAIVALIFVASIIIQFLVFEFVRSAAVVYLDSLDRVETIPSAEALDRAQQRLGIITGAAIRSSLIVAAFSVTIIGIPFAINRLVRWAFLGQVIMLEDKRGEDVLAASSDLVSGYWWSTFGRLIVTGLVIGLPTVIVSGIANAAIPAIGAAFVDAALVFVTAPYGIISTTLMYYHLQTRKARHDSFSPDRHAAP